MMSGGGGPVDLSSVGECEERLLLHVDAGLTRVCARPTSRSFCPRSLAAPLAASYRRPAPSAQSLLPQHASMQSPPWRRFLRRADRAVRGRATKIGGHCAAVSHPSTLALRKPNRGDRGTHRCFARTG